MKLESTSRAKFDFDLTTLVIWANTYFATRLLCLFCLFVTLTGLTSGPILTICTSYNVFPRKDVHFGVFVDISPHVGGQTPVNGHFQA